MNHRPASRRRAAQGVGGLLFLLVFWVGAGLFFQHHMIARWQGVYQECAVPAALGDDNAAEFRRAFDALERADPLSASARAVLLALAHRKVT